MQFQQPLHTLYTPMATVRAMAVERERMIAQSSSIINFVATSKTVNIWSYDIYIYSTSQAPDRSALPWSQRDLASTKACDFTLLLPHESHACTAFTDVVVRVYVDSGCLYNGLWPVSTARSVQGFTNAWYYSG